MVIFEQLIVVDILIVIRILGLLLAYSGYDSVGGNDANATVSAALISNIWETFERQGNFFFKEYQISNRNFYYK